MFSSQGLERLATVVPRVVPRARSAVADGGRPRGRSDDPLRRALASKVDALRALRRKRAAPGGGASAARLSTPPRAILGNRPAVTDRPVAEEDAAGGAAGKLKKDVEEEKNKNEKAAAGRAGSVSELANSAVASPPQDRAASTGADRKPTAPGGGVGAPPPGEAMGASPSRRDSDESSRRTRASFALPSSPAVVDAEAIRANVARGFESVAEKVRDEVRKLRSSTRAATHPPLPVVGTFEELLRFANIASLNSSPTEEIEAFFAETNETVTVLDLESVKQRAFIATDHARRTHTVSFRGTTNLTNVVQNIRLSNDPVTASGRLASVGRSLSGAFSGLRGAGGDPTAAGSGDGSGSGSFDEDDPEGACENVSWDASPEERARLGCTDHLPMHRGYRVIARECRDAIAPHVQPGYSVQITGHSLGGAVAVAVGLLYTAAGVDVTKVVTFGAPKLGPKETRDAAEKKLAVLRVVQKDDIIPLLPMSRPFVRKPYVHLGEGVMLDNEKPGRYAQLAKEWGTAGILWKHRAHLGYARGTEENEPPLSEERKVIERRRGDEDEDATEEKTLATAARKFREARSSGSSGPSGSSGSGSARVQRFLAARRRLANLLNLRAALRDALPARPSRDDAPKEEDDASSTSPGLERAPPRSEWAREVARWASKARTVSSASGGGGAKNANDAMQSQTNAVPFDDVEGELFVRLAETEGGAAEAAEKAASAWERASEKTALLRDDVENKIARVGVEDGGGGDAFDRALASSAAAQLAPRAFLAKNAGPTIFETLWGLRRLDSEARREKLECHRMRRYVDAVERAIAAGPVQTSLSGIYTGESEDEVGLDMAEEGDDSEGVATWMTWSR